jgi:hypothetical protein
VIAGAALAALSAGGVLAATAPKAAKAKACTYVYYVKVFAFVHENPSTNSVVRESKSAYARLTGPCHGSENGFFPVYSSATTDGLGWVDRSKLYGPY